MLCLPVSLETLELSYVGSVISHLVHHAIYGVRITKVHGIAYTKVRYNTIGTIQYNRYIVVTRWHFYQGSLVMYLSW